MPAPECRRHALLPAFAGYVVACAVASPVFAAEMDLSIHAGDTYTDNVAFSNASKRSDHVAGVATKLGLATQGPRLQATMTTALTYLHYVNNTFEDQIQRGFTGEGRFSLIEGRLSWAATENYGPVLQDPLSVDRPDNLTYDNYFTTGPDLTLGSPTALHLLMGARYGRVDYEVPNTPGNQQYTGNISIILPTSERVEKSINFSERRINQEKPSVATTQFHDDYDTREAYARYSSKGVRNTLHVDAGVSMLSGGGISSNAPLLRLGLGRKLTPRITLSASAGSQYQDSLGRFQRLQSAPVTTTGSISDPRNDVTNTASPMQEKYVDVVLSYDGVRTNFDLRGAHNRVKFERDTSSLAIQRYSSASLALQHLVTPTWTLNLEAEYDRRYLGVLGRADDDLFGYAGSSWRLQPKLQLDLGYQYRSRSSSDAGSGYTANSIQLQIVYRPYSEIGTRARANRWQQTR